MTHGGAQPFCTAYSPSDTNAQGARPYAYFQSFVFPGTNFFYRLLLCGAISR